MNSFWVNQKLHGLKISVATNMPQIEREVKSCFFRSLELLISSTDNVEKLKNLPYDKKRL